MAEVNFPKYAFPKLSHRSKKRGKRRFVFLISPNPDPLEYIGPMNALRLTNFVFENSSIYDCGYEPEIISSEAGVVFKEHGLTLHVDKAYYDLSGEVDTLVVSPMNWEDLFGRDDNFLPWLREQQKKLRRIGSICSATFVLAEAGILNGRRATTHWDLVPDLQSRYPEIIVDGKPLYVRDENVYTAAGMTAGVDMTIAMIEEDYGREVALRVAQAMVLFVNRPGDQAQFGIELATRLPDTSVVARVQQYVQENIRKNLTIEQLAEIANMSPRNFSRVFKTETGVPPGKYIERFRLEVARQVILESRTPISEVAKRCGYQSADTMRNAFERALGINPREYRERFYSAELVSH